MSLELEGRRDTGARYIDHIVGKLLKALDYLKLRDDTIIILTSDNGTSGSISGILNDPLVRGGKIRTTEVSSIGADPLDKKNLGLFRFKRKA